MVIGVKPVEEGDISPIKWNNSHIKMDVLEQFKPITTYLFKRASTTGPLFIGKLWVSVKGNYMLLPVWAVRRIYKTKIQRIMIYARVLLLAFIVLAVIYYIMVIGQLFSKWKITNREIKFSFLCIPFYYWMVSQEEKKQVKRKINIKKKKDGKAKSN